MTHHTHILIHSELPLPPRELADGDDGGEGNARDQHHVETCEYVVLVIISIESTLICWSCYIVKHADVYSIMRQQTCQRCHGHLVAASAARHLR